MPCDQLHMTGQIPRWPLSVAGAYLLARALLRFKRWGDETQQAARFFAVFAALLVELTIDNAFTWYFRCKFMAYGSQSRLRMA